MFIDSQIWAYYAIIHIKYTIKICFMIKKMQQTLVSSYNKKIKLHIFIIAVIGLISTLLACSNQVNTTEEAMTAKEKSSIVATSTIKVTMDMPGATRTGYIDYDVKDNTVPKATTNSNFRTYALLVSSKGRKAWFEFDWTKVTKNAQNKVSLTARSFVITLNWIDTNNLGTTITKDNSETWKISAITGGAKMENGRLLFDDAMQDENGRSLAKNQKKVALYSKWSTATITNVNSVAGTLLFKPLGVTFQVKIDGRSNLGDSYNRNYVFYSNSISPLGYFDISKNSDSWNTSVTQPKWVSTESRNVYEYRYTPNSSNLSNKAKQDIFLVWGMPNKKYTRRPITTVYSTQSDIIVAKRNLLTPHISYKDYSLADAQGKTFFYNAEATHLVTSPEVNFPIPLGRLAIHNVGTTRKTFAPNDLISTTGYYSFRDVAENQSSYIPDGYHLPTKDEWTIAFPYIHTKENQEIRMGSLDDFGTVEEYCVLGDLQIKYNAQYRGLGDGKTLYAIRFIDDNNPDARYRNKFKSAYRYDFYNYGGNNAAVRIRARYIGEAPITIDEVATEDYWSLNVPSDVERTLPFAGYKTAGVVRDKGIMGFYWVDNHKNSLRKWYSPITNDRIYGIRDMYWSEQLAARPVSNIKWRP